MYERFWKTKVQPSTHTIPWKVMKNKIASKTNLERRGIIGLSYICSTCGEEEETTSHLFFKCRIAWLVWRMCYAWMEMVSVDHFNTKTHCLHFILFDVSEGVNLV